jgi:hypothetical protein
LSKIGMVAGIAGGLGQLAGIQGPTLGETFGGSGADTSGNSARRYVYLRAGAFKSKPSLRHPAMWQMAATTRMRWLHTQKLLMRTKQVRMQEAVRCPAGHGGTSVSS